MRPLTDRESKVGHKWSRVSLRPSSRPIPPAKGAQGDGVGISGGYSVPEPLARSMTTTVCVAQYGRQWAINTEGRRQAPGEKACFLQLRGPCATKDTCSLVE